ncbi:hypothetical protein BD779DRAFT_1541530 [Infundibulicybe gibba]|nr:hypothetical protein BD779DRAFT_1541530 [Infundibulicybe gibba]
MVMGKAPLVVPPVVGKASVVVMVVGGCIGAGEFAPPDVIETPMHVGAGMIVVLAGSTVVMGGMISVISGPVVSAPTRPLVTIAGDRNMVLMEDFVTKSVIVTVAVIVGVGAGAPP